MFQLKRQSSQRSGLNSSVMDDSSRSEDTLIGKADDKGAKSERSNGGGGTWLWKTLMVVLLCLIGAAAGFAFIYGLISRDVQATNTYFKYANHIAEQSLARARQIHFQMEPLNSYFTTHAMNSRNDSWPFVSLRDYHSVAQSFATEGTSELVAIAPLVSKADQEAWEDYSVQHQAWTWSDVDQDGGLTAHGRRHLRPVNSTIPTRIYTRDLEYDPENGEDSRREDTGPGPFAPLWQMYPIPHFSSDNRDLSPVNYDILSHPSIARAVAAIETHRAAILTEPIPMFELFGIHGTYAALKKGEGGNETMVDLREPHSVIVSPIYDDFSAAEGHQPTELVALALKVVPWKVFFQNLIPHGQNGIFAVLRAGNCGETFTFKVNGQESVFVGYGDLHDKEQDYFDGRSQSTFGPFMTLGDNSDIATGDFCQYTLHVFPSNTFYEAHSSDLPRIFAAAMVGIFLFVCAALMLYNCYARRQERRIRLVLKRSNAIVEKFFPSEVKNRLLESGHNGGEENAKASGWTKKKPMASQRAIDQKELVPLTLNRENTAIAFEGKPIATLFPQCTVMFAQIVGFTKWSVERSPEDTFALLESVYGAFDDLTARRNVFKVETIGDCYLAVTGLPEPQKEHAVIMARFSRSIMEKFRDVIAQLEPTLGPETAQLQLRIGLNSGPVTAGVLRGQKTSHFQLFGDTVNTASRMQSTGVTGRIQVSAETAALLEHSSSKTAKSWLIPREEKVQAKGKGELSTFFLSTTPGSVSGSSHVTRSSTAGSELGDLDAPRTPKQRSSIRLAPRFPPSVAANNPTLPI